LRKLQDIGKRFWSKVRIDNPNDCWPWNAYIMKRKNGELAYGMFYLHGSPQLAHRVAYLLKYGAIPEGKNVCHNCDNTVCCNPSHLRADTQLGNIVEMDTKGRRVVVSSVGVKNGNAKLTVKQIEAIRSTTGISDRKLASQYNVSHCTINRVRHYRVYKGDREDVC
jgi:hypothetical protein